jgi:hypothetical protein
LGFVRSYLKPWTIEFDLMKETVALIKVWAIFPGLPRAFWSREAIGAIGNKLGSFVRPEPNWASKKDSRWAWIQVEVDVTEGLVKSIDIVFEDKHGTIR